MTHIQFVVLFSLCFQVRSNLCFPFFLCNVIVSRSHALRHGKWHLSLRDAWECWVGEGGGGVIARAVRFRQDFLFVSRVFVANVC